HHPSLHSFPTRRSSDLIVVTFDENSGVYFDTAKYNINSASQATLDKLSSVLREYPDTNVLIVGHTDSVGADAMNMTLSKNRAQRSEEHTSELQSRENLV